MLFPGAVSQAAERRPLRVINNKNNNSSNDKGPKERYEVGSGGSDCGGVRGEPTSFAKLSRAKRGRGMGAESDHSTHPK